MSYVKTKFVSINKKKVYKVSRIIDGVHMNLAELYANSDTKIR